MTTQLEPPGGALNLPTTRELVYAIMDERLGEILAAFMPDLREPDHIGWAVRVKGTGQWKEVADPVMAIQQNGLGQQMRLYLTWNGMPQPEDLDDPAWRVKNFPQLQPDEEYKTPSGRILTGEEVDRLAQAQEPQYDPEDLLERIYARDEEPCDD